MKYKLADGTSVEVPPDPTQEELEWLHSQGAEPDRSFGDVLVDSGKSLLSGASQGALALPFIAGDLGSFASTFINKARPGTIDPKYEVPPSQRAREVYQDLTGATFHQPETAAGRYARSTGEAISGMALGGPKAFMAPTRLAPVGSTARVLGNPVVQGGATGAAAELGGDISRGFDEDKEQNPLARFIGGASTALVSALGRRIQTPSELKPLHDLTKNLTPRDMAAAQAETRRLQTAGATSNTIGDSFPPTSQISPLERDLSNKLGGEPLHAKLVGRGVEGGDIQRLLGEAKTSAQQASVPGNVLGSPTNVIGTRDELIASLARKNRTASMTPHLRNAPLLPENDLQRVIQALNRRAGLSRNMGTEDENFLSNAARTVDGLPRFNMPQPPAPGRMSGPGVVTGGPQAPVAGGMPQPGLPSPALALPAPTGTAMVPYAPQNGAVTSPGMPAIPAGQAQSYGPGSGFTFPNNQPITDIYPEIPKGVNLEALSKEVKRLATVGDSAPTGPAGTVLKNAAAGGAARNTSRFLEAVSPDYKAAMAAYRANSPAVNVTRALADTKLATVPNSLTSSGAQDALRAQLALELRKVNPQAATQVGEKLRTADILSRNTAERGIEGMNRTLAEPPAGALVAPFRAMWNALSQSGALKANKNLANLLANPTEANYAKLLEIARTDPALATAIRERGLIGAVANSTQVEGN